MGKYSAGPTMVMTWQPSGSTTVTTISGQARNLDIDGSMDAADATGYGNANRQYVATIEDATASFELFLDDTTLTVEDLFQSGNEGTLIASPAGVATGTPKITFVGFVSTASRHYPFDDVATMDVELMPTADVVFGTNS